MKVAHRKYLKNFKIDTTAEMDVISGIISHFEGICPEKIDQIFITDYIDKEGNHRNQNLWCISDNYLMEAKEYNTRSDFDILFYKNKICWLTWSVENFQFDEGNSNSRLSVHFELGSNNVTGDMKAARNNCKLLWNIVQEIFIPNLSES